MNWILIGIMLTTFLVLVSGRMKSRIQAIALQGVLLSALYLSIRESSFDYHTILLVFITFAIKTLFIPIFIFKSFKNLSNKLAGSEPSVSMPILLIGGCVLTVLSFTGTKIFSALNPALSSTLAMPTALSTLLIGFWILVTKTKATNQVIGFLLIENGVFVFGMTIVSDFPLMVELGVLLDLVVGVFVMGIIVYQINRTFDHIDTRTLAMLGDE